MCTWLDALPVGSGGTAAMETRIWWSPGSASRIILSRLSNKKGHRPGGKAERFSVWAVMACFANSNAPDAGTRSSRRRQSRQPLV